MTIKIKSGPKVGQFNSAVRQKKFTRPFREHFKVCHTDGASLVLIRNLVVQY